jgi:RNA polymerase sigma factor (sigma-70 family)
MTDRTRTPAPPGRRRRPDLTVDVDAARAGSVAAFERLYRSTAPSVAGYLRWHGASDPEGLANEVFLQVHRNLAGFVGDGERFRSWLFTVAHHRMIDDRRQMSRRPRIDDGTEVDEAALVGDVESDALAELGHDRLHALLETLSPDQRSVLLLRVVADLPIDAVATALGKRPGAIKALQHRALASLRRQLEREEVLL